MNNYQIIASGSSGNAVIINEIILIDCGVPFNKITNYYKKLKLVCLTHIHTDHFNKPTIKRLALERPTLRFLCGEWLLGELLSLNIPSSNIDVIPMNRRLYYKGIGTFKAIALTHDVLNCGYRIDLDTEYSIFYATDTGHLDNIVEQNLDLYLIEANYDDNKIKENIQKKKSRGFFSYETRVLNTHLSQQQTDKWLQKNCNLKSEIVYLHRSEYN